MSTTHQPLKIFRVRVGHWEVQVRAADAEAAVEIARRQLARELPRLYDLIRALTAPRFHVEAAA
jgi:hypothetical protein